MTIGIAVFWIACGVLDYGLNLAHFQRKFNCYGLAKKHRAKDTQGALFAAMMGPIGLLATLSLGHCRHGWLLFPLPDHEINYGGEKV